MNELLLIFTLILAYGSAILLFRFFGKEGLFCLSIIVTILANIEVLIVVDAFGMEMTLGNVLFAATFLITDVLSENYGKRTAQKAVLLSTLASVFFVVLSQMWLLYTPSANDWAFPSFQMLFANTPRIIVASLIVFVITQTGDVWLYHKWWEFTEKHFGSKRKGLWIRNNGSTLVSQLFNAILYNVLAFAGMYNTSTLISIIVSTYVIYIATSLLDTPVAYLCRRIRERYDVDGFSKGETKQISA